MIVMKGDHAEKLAVHDPQMETGEVRSSS